MPGCPICGAAEAVTRTGTHTTFAGCQLFRCHRCQHGFAFPEPSAAELDAHYAGEYCETRRRFFGDVYFSIMEQRARAQYAFIAGCLHAAGPGATARRSALDLGCGTGALVSVLRHHGVDAIGWDSDPTCRELARQLWRCQSVFPPPAEVRDGVGDRFDLLCLSHFVEHMRDLRPSLEKTLHLLRPGGCVFVEVPNCPEINCETAPDMESHLHFFTPASLSRVLQSCGLQGVQCRTCGPPLEKAPAGAGGNCGQRGVSGIARDAVVCLVERRQEWLPFPRRLIPVRTPYDGFYRRYYDGGDRDVGGWIRCCARTPA